MPGCKGYEQVGVANGAAVGRAQRRVMPLGDRRPSSKLKLQCARCSMLTSCSCLAPPACGLPKPPAQVDAEFDVSGKASEAARAAAEAARKVNEAAEEADSKFQFRRRARILWSDLKRAAPMVRGGGRAGAAVCGGVRDCDSSGMGWQAGSCGAASDVVVACGFQ